ncbi:MAG TPA: hypothetical protein VE198_01030 [Actinoallomurus sp.]|nr:hypothetical protein [Actinoallomurus sp.]
MGLPVRANPLGLHAPAVLAVGPLLRELIIEYTRAPEGDGDEAERRRLQAVLLERLRHSPWDPVNLPTSLIPAAPLVADPAKVLVLALMGARREHHMVPGSPNRCTRAGSWKAVTAAMAGPRNVMTWTA